MILIDFNRFKLILIKFIKISQSWLIFDVGFFDFEKMAFLDIFDMYLMIFDINSQYFVKIRPAVTAAPDTTAEATTGYRLSGKSVPVTFL